MAIMVHIEVSATIERTEEHRDAGSDGHDDYTAHADLRETREVEATLNFADGYVNLEGYAASEYYRTASEVIESVLMKAGVNTTEWSVCDADAEDVSITGNDREWFTAARRYVAERPNMRVRDAVEMFAGWDCTNLTHDRVPRVLDAEADSDTA